ncbi:MAG: hypothetical protein K2P43_15890, partial [Lachnospiraceae bacterium]|nr:hypothetical protein [Lachnospiraceae bacterium]
MDSSRNSTPLTEDAITNGVRLDSSPVRTTEVPCARLVLVLSCSRFTISRLSLEVSSRSLT